MSPGACGFLGQLRSLGYYLIDICMYLNSNFINNSVNSNIIIIPDNKYYQNFVIWKNREIFGSVFSPLSHFKGT